MNRRKLLSAFGLGTLWAALPVRAQRAARMRRIAFHSPGTGQSNGPNLAAFRQGMSALGWNDGRDYVIDERYANGDYQIIPRVIGELLAAKPDLILVPGETSARAFLERTKSIPIVLTVSVDPVGMGLVSNLQRPGGSVTGLTSLSGELSSKRLQLLREAVPRITNVAVPFQAVEAVSRFQLKELETAAPRLKMRITPLEITGPQDLAPQIKRGISLGAQAFVINQTPVSGSLRRTIAEALLRSRIPALFYPPNVIDSVGELMTYGPSIGNNYRRAAIYVDKIFKGAKPGDLPIEQPTRFELVVNLKVAKALGLTIPQSVLLQAERVIE